MVFTHSSRMNFEVRTHLFRLCCSCFRDSSGVEAARVTRTRLAAPAPAPGTQGPGTCLLLLCYWEPGTCAHTSMLHISTGTRPVLFPPHVRSSSHTKLNQSYLHHEWLWWEHLPNVSNTLWIKLYTFYPLLYFSWTSKFPSKLFSVSPSFPC